MWEKNPEVSHGLLPGRFEESTVPGEVRRHAAQSMGVLPLCVVKDVVHQHVIPGLVAMQGYVL